MRLHLEGERGREHSSLGQAPPPPPSPPLYQTLVLYSFSKSESSTTSVDMVQGFFVVFFAICRCNYLKCAQRWSSAIAMVSHYACAL